MEEYYKIAEELFVLLYNSIERNPSVTLATLSVMLNMILLKKALYFNNKYIELLIKNSGIQDQMNKLLDSFHIKKEIKLIENEDKKEEKK